MAGQEYFGIRIETEKLEQDAQQAKKAFDGIADEAVKAGKTIDSVFSGKGFSENLEKQFLEISKVALGAFDGISESAQKMIKEIQQSTLQLRNVERLMSELNAAYESGSVSQNDYINAAARLTVVHEKISNSIRNTEAALKAETTVIDKLADDSMTALQAKVTLLTTEYMKLSKAQRESAQGESLLNNIAEINTELQRAQATMSKYGATATTQFNALGFSMQQIVRELPSLTMSPQMFFLAISNNLPMFTEALANARKEFQAMTASGKDAIPVWKQVAKSLLSWQTAISLLPTLLLLYGDKIIDFFENILTGSKKVDLAAESIERFREALAKGLGNAQGEVTELKLLYEATQDVTTSMENREKAVDALQDKYPSYFGNMKDEDILAGRAADSYERLTNAIVASAKAKAMADLISENELKIYEKEIELQDKRSELEKKRANYEQKAQAYANNKNAFTALQLDVARNSMESTEEEIGNLIDELYKLQKFSTDTKNRIDVSDLIFNSKDSGAEGGVKSEAVDNLKQYLNDLLGLKEDNEERQIELTKQGIEKQIALIELRYKRQIEAVKKLQEDLKKAQGGKLTEEQQGIFGTAITGLQNIQQSEVTTIVNKQVEAEQKKLQKVIEKYQDYSAQIKSIEEEMNEDISYLQSKRTKENSENIDRAIKVAKEKAAKAIKEITDEEAKSLFTDSGLFSRLFSDSSSMTKSSLKQVIEETKKLVNYLEGISTDKPFGFTEKQLNALKEDASSIKDIYNALIEKQDELDKRTDYPFDGIIKGFKKIKDSAELAKKAIEETDEEKKKLLQSQSEAEYGKGVSYLKEGALKASDAIGFISEQVAILAEATGDPKFKEFSDQFSAFSQNLQAAVQGAQSGGWIGAIVGGAFNMITQTVASMAQLQAEAHEYEQNRIDFLRELEQISLTLKDENYDSIFGTSSIERARDAYKLAQEALQKYNEELQKTSALEFEEEYKNLGAAIFFPIFGFFGFGKKISEKTKALMAAYEKGYTDLQAMAVKTKDRSGWANFWGKKDEYTALKDLAPELWNEDGTFNVEAAEAFLDTNTQISEEQRKQIQNVIDLKNAYDENISIIDEMLASTFGSLSSDITDIIFDSVRNGTDAWEQFREVGSGVIDELGKQMIQELYVQTYLETFKERMRAAYGLDSVEDTQKELANIMADIYNGLGSVFAGASSAAEEWDRWATEHGFTPGAESGTGDVSSTIDGLDELKKAYEELSIEVSKTYSSESVKILQQQNDNLREQARLIKERISAGFSSEELIEQLEDINKQIVDNEEAMKDAIFGEDIQSAISNFVSAYTEALGNGGNMQNMTRDFIESMIQSMVTESMKADASPIIENVREKLLEAWKDGVVTEAEQISIEEIINNLNKELSDKYGWAEGIFGEYNIKGLEELQNAYNELSDSISKAFSSEKANLLKEQSEILKQQRDLIKERLEAEKALGERGDESLINEWNSQLEEVEQQIQENKEAQLDAIFGQDTQTQISNLANALINVWSGAEKKADSAKDFINNIIKSMVLESLSMDLTPFIEELRKSMAEMFEDGIISAEEGDALAGMVESVMDSLEKQYEWADRFIKEEEEVVEEIKETFSNITFESMRDDFTSQLSDMTSSYEDMCQNFEEKLKESIIRGFIESKYKNQIQSLISTWDMYGASGNIDSEEMEKLREQYKDLISAMIKDRDELAEQFGWSKYQQEATSSVGTTITQETGEEISGRLTAIYESSLRLENIQLAQLDIMQKITGNSEYVSIYDDIMRGINGNKINTGNVDIESINDNVKGMKDFVQSCYLEMMEIRENTGAVVKPIQQMQKDMAEMKNAIKEKL